MGIDTKYLFCKEITIKLIDQITWKTITACAQSYMFCSVLKHNTHITLLQYSVFCVNLLVSVYVQSHIAKCIFIIFFFIWVGMVIHF